MPLEHCYNIMNAKADTTCVVTVQKLPQHVHNVSVNHNEGSKRRQQTSKHELRDRFSDKNSEGAEL